MTYVDPLIQTMKANDIPITRETYLDLAYPDGVPDPWTTEHEIELPPEVRWDGRGSPPFKIGHFSISQWAAYLAQDDKSRIDSAIRSGIIGGLDNTEIARKVIGSSGLHGVDGVTEVTRQRITQLGRAAIKAANLRKKGKKS